MKGFLFFIVSLMTLQSDAQLTLDSCISQSLRHFQFEKESMGIDQEGDLLVSNASKNWYPDMYLEYRSTFQNQQIQFPSALPGNAPQVPLDFHRLLLNFSQTIYDGSVSAQRKKIERQGAENRKIQVEGQAVEVRSQVVKLYMTALLLERQAEIIKAGLNGMQAQYEKLKSAGKEGVILISDLRSLEAEILTMNMKDMEIVKDRELVIMQLFEIMGVATDPDVQLVVPVAEIPEAAFEQRPEIRLMRSQIVLMESQKKLYSSSHVPKIQVFGSAGAGNPGYNILDPSIKPMALVGIGLRWDFWDWNEVSNQKEILSIRQDNMSYAIERKLTALRSEVNSQLKEVEKLEEVLSMDRGIIFARQEVVNIKSSQLENGVITSSDYIVELNKLNAAELGLEMHELELISAKLNYNIISGN